MRGMHVTRVSHLEARDGMTSLSQPRGGGNRGPTASQPARALALEHGAAAAGGPAHEYHRVSVEQRLVQQLAPHEQS